MITKSPGAGGLPTTSDNNPRRKETAARRPQNRDEPLTRKPIAFVLSNSVVVAREDHTRIEHVESGTDYGEPLPVETLNSLDEVARE